VEEFNLQRYKKSKFVFYLLAVGMICSIWFVEQAAGAEWYNIYKITIIN
jgi:hypothetical protein